MKCLEECIAKKQACTQKECRLWINFKEEYNCIGETVRRNGKLTLRDVAKRMGVSFVRIKQIQDAAIKKIRKKCI